MEIHDLTGRVFNSWTVITLSPITVKGSGKTFWDCRCKCGIQKAVEASTLKRGTSKSCGCLTEHKKIKTSTYKRWALMKARCLNPNNNRYQYYGGRGIKVCERWLDFRNFYADMGDCPEGMTIERIDSDGNYEPSNCKWLKKEEQSKNRRSNIKIAFNGKTQNLMDWAKELNLSPGTLYSRIERGWSFERTLTDKGRLK